MAISRCSSAACADTSPPRTTALPDPKDAEIAALEAELAAAKEAAEAVDTEIVFTNDKAKKKK